MIPRTLKQKILALVKQFPALALFGPRQSGKTTLVKALFPEYKYVNLESFEHREFAEQDSKGFLEQFRKEKGVIFDEIQKVPKLLSYIQLEIDTHQKIGFFILTGSQNILLNHHVGQTLAGRVALLTLLPFSIQELREADQLPETASEAMFQGFYPRIYDNQVDPVVFSESYIRTYVERDVRDLKQISSLSDFQRFMQLCAGRIGQLLNLSSLSIESGISLNTVKSWLSVLEASYIIFLIQPYYKNFNKRVVKMPKLYFYDTALACHLLRLTKAADVYEHYLKGALFESMIISDLLKNRYHQGLASNVYFWRDKSGHEVDCILEEGIKTVPLEIKASATIQSEMLHGIVKWQELSKTPEGTGIVVYGGSEHQKRSSGEIKPWSSL